MSAPAANPFFEACDPLGLTGWTPQTGGGETITEQEAVALGADGDKIASKGFDKKSEISVVYIAESEGTEIPNVGQMKNGWHIDSVNVTLSQNDFAKMTVNAHKHVSGNADANTRQYAPTVGKVGGFGCPSSFGPFSLGASATCGVKTITYNLQCNHVDELKGDGNHFAGDNYDGTEQVTVELTGTFTFAEGTDGWHLDTNAANKQNTAATALSATYTKHIGHVVPASSPAQTGDSGSGSGTGS